MGRINYLQRFKQTICNAKIVAVLTAGIVVAANALAAAPVQAQQAAVRDNSTNSIVRGGTLTNQEFVDKARANNPADLQAIFSAYGLTPDEYDRFLRDAKTGTAYKNGDISVGGKVVARGAYSLGREQKSYSTAKAINGTTYHESRAQDVFRPASMPVLVLMGADGRMEFAALTPCGNPVRATPVTPQVTPPAPTPTPPAPTPPTPKPISSVHKCIGLRTSQDTGNRLKYGFTAIASHRNATLQYADFNFGDGNVRTNVRPTSTATPSNGTTIVSTPIGTEHTYAQAGNYTVSATLHFSVTGSDGTVTDYSESCQASVTPQAAPITPVSTTPQAPATLPAAGVGEFIALFVAVSVMGSAGYYVYTKRRMAQA